MTLTMQGVLADRSRWQADECSVSKAMEIVGTRSAMLLLREAAYGTTRFDAFATRVGITPAVAASRLKELVEAGLLTKRPYREPGRRTRDEYVLTEMGVDLVPAIAALMQWGDKYLQPDGAPVKLVELGTGTSVRVELRTLDGREVAVADVAVRAARRRKR